MHFITIVSLVSSDLILGDTTYDISFFMIFGNAPAGAIINHFIDNAAHALQFIILLTFIKTSPLVAGDSGSFPDDVSQHVFVLPTNKKVQNYTTLI